MSKLCQCIRNVMIYKSGCEKSIGALTMGLSLCKDSESLEELYKAKLSASLRDLDFITQDSQIGEFLKRGYSRASVAECKIAVEIAYCAGSFQLERVKKAIPQVNKLLEQGYAGVLNYNQSHRN